MSPRDNGGDVLGSIRVMPLNGQVVLSREGSVELPVPDTGTEAVVANRSAVLVATRGDREGDVLIEVRRSADTGEFAHEIYRGSLQFENGRLVIGSPLANQSKVVDVGRRGTVPITVYVDRTDGPSKVIVVVA